ncbi:hypothetical protein Droror1_Dr00003072 [Drosera rotundifolia]
MLGVDELTLWLKSEFGVLGRCSCRWEFDLEFDDGITTFEVWSILVRGHGVVKINCRMRSAVLLMLLREIVTKKLRREIFALMTQTNFIATDSIKKGNHSGITLYINQVADDGLPDGYPNAMVALSVSFLKLRNHWFMPILAVGHDTLSHLVVKQSRETESEP